MAKLKLNFHCVKDCHNRCSHCIVMGIYHSTFSFFSIKDRKEWVIPKTWQHPVKNIFYDGKLIWKKAKKFKRECKNCQSFKDSKCQKGFVSLKDKCSNWHYKLN